MTAPSWHIGCRSRGETGEDLQRCYELVFEKRVRTGEELNVRAKARWQEDVKHAVGGGKTRALSQIPFPLHPHRAHAYLPFEELLDLGLVTLRIRGDVDRLGIESPHPELHGPLDFLQVGEAHGHGESGGCAAAVAHTLRRGHEVGARSPVLQHGTGVLLRGGWGHRVKDGNWPGTPEARASNWGKAGNMGGAQQFFFLSTEGRGKWLKRVTVVISG